MREAGEVLAPGEVVNSAGHAVAALVALWGGGAHRQPTLPDDPRRDPRRDRGCARRHPAVHRRRIGRETSLPMLPAMFATAILEGGSRETWWRASAAIDGTGRLVVTPDPRRDSSLQRPLAEANALIRRPSGALASGAGELVDITLIAAIRLRSA